MWQAVEIDKGRAEFGFIRGGHPIQNLAIDCAYLIRPFAVSRDRCRHSARTFFRKGIVGDWKNYMTDQARVWIREEAGEELIRQGYADSLDW